MTAVAVSAGQVADCTIFVTVYVPGVLADKLISPVLVFAKTNPAIELNVPALPPPLYVGKGFSSF